MTAHTPRHARATRTQWVAASFVIGMICAAGAALLAGFGGAW